MKKLFIRLNGGREALVDSEFSALAWFRWHVHVNASGGLPYAAKSLRLRRETKSRRLMMHDAVLEMADIEVPPGMVVDHVNGNTLDNRLKNLRAVTKRQNRLNVAPYGMKL